MRLQNEIDTCLRINLANEAIHTVRERVHACPELAAAPAGREILARIALTEGKPDAALTIYQELGVNSVDAMIYLSKDAFARKNWELARKWTGELARRFPSEPKFR